MLPHKAPYALRQIVTADPKVSATPGAHAEKMIYDVASEKAKEEAAADVYGRKHSLRDMALEQKGEQFDKTMEIKQQALGLEQEKLDYLNEQRERATIFAGISAGLNLAGAWWQTKKLDEVIDKYTGQMGYIEERFKNINALIGRQMESIPDQDEIDAAAKGKLKR